MGGIARGLIAHRYLLVSVRLIRSISRYLPRNYRGVKYIIPLFNLRAAKIAALIIIEISAVLSQRHELIRHLKPRDDALNPRF